MKAHNDFASAAGVAAQLDAPPGASPVCGRGRAHRSAWTSGASILRRRAFLSTAIALGVAALAGCSRYSAIPMHGWYLGTWKLDPEETARLWERAGKLDHLADLAIRTRAYCSMNIEDGMIRVELFGDVRVTTYKVVYGSEKVVELSESEEDGKERRVRMEMIGESRMRTTFGNDSLPEVWDRKL